LHRNTRKSIIRYSILTAFALDTAGYAFEYGYTHDEIDEWCSGDRLEYPLHKQLNLAGTPSFNSDLFSVLLFCLMENGPKSTVGVDKFIEDFNRVAAPFLEVHPECPYSKYLRGQTATGLLIPLSTAIGYYCALEGFTVPEYSDFVIEVLSAFDVKEEVDAAIVFSYFIYRLVLSGYFGYSIMKEAHLLRLYDKRFLPAIEKMMENNLDPVFLTTFDYMWFENDSYFFNALIYVVYIMLRIDTAYPKEVLKSLPRDQLTDVFNVEQIKKQDIGFIYGAMCTSSEHKHPLVPKPLRESVKYIDLINISLNYKVK
jgi:hypothetical protein